MLDPSPRPRVYGLPPGADFPRAVVSGIRERLSAQPPEALARVTLIVNTQRMERRLTALFAEAPGTLLPKIVTLAQVPEAFAVAGLPPPRHPLRRKLELARLISAYLDRAPDAAPRSAVFALADSLGALMDEMQGEAVPPDALHRLDVSNMSDHWARSLAFVSIVRDYTEARSDGALDAEARQLLAVEALVARWAAAPPAHPVILAGSTGSRATTARLMAAVAHLPQGAAILPGYDFEMPQETWDALGDGRLAEDHPQSRFAALLARIGLTPSDVRPWTADTGPTARNRLVSLALRPAPVTDQWLRDGPGLGDLAQSAGSLTLIEAPNPRTEAQAIALRLRQAVEDGQTAALVTPDRTLTRQVAAALSRWGIEPDDSAGRPLAMSAPGRFLRQTAGMIGAAPTSRDLIALLKHPLAHSTPDQRGAHLLQTRELELFLRKRALVFPTRAGIQAWCDAGDATRTAWADWVFEALEQVAPMDSASLGDFVDGHLGLATRLAAGPGFAGSGELWEKAAGERARDAMDGLGAAADALGVTTAQDYRALLNSVLAGGEVRDPVLPHPGVMIWGTLEARVQGAELVILGGLNDGVWPEMPAPDPWLNRAMRRDAGLLMPERRVGLSAHDFQQAIAAPEVVITRALRDTEAETVPSRWLNRIVNLMSGLPGQNGALACEDIRGRGRTWVQAALALDTRLTPVQPARRPAPAPPPAMRPGRLSVTEIRTLVRDPYAIHARHVLRLASLDPLDRKPDAALKGSAIHAVIERFMRSGLDPASPEAGAQLAAIAEDVMARMVPWPSTARLWLARFRAIIPGFLQGEVLRRAAGAPYPPERRGRMRLVDPDFELVGTADRIDRLTNGRLAIYDYKTGTIPSDEDVRRQDRQLLLEAVMAEAGGFADVPPDPVDRVGYVAVSASGQDRDFACTRTDKADYRTETVAAEFARLIAAYAEADQGFAARRDVGSTRFEGRYDQLARYGEWDDSDTPVVERLE